MEILQTMLSGSEPVTFAGLFIALLVWVINTNDKRETRYQDTIDKLSNALTDFAELKESIEEIKNKVDKWSDKI